MLPTKPPTKPGRPSAVVPSPDDPGRPPSAPRAQPGDPDRPLTYRINDACRKTGLSRTSIYKLFADGSLPFLTVGKTKLIRDVDLRRRFGIEG
jgi:excisionase family DNA binding protein